MPTLHLPFSSHNSLPPPSPPPTLRNAQSVCKPVTADPPSVPLVLPSDPTLQQDRNLDLTEMFCRACQQYFSSLYNMREHLVGRKHRLMIGTEIDEESKKIMPSIPIFTEEFIRHNRQREEELRELRRSSVLLEEQNRSLGEANIKLKETIDKLSDDAANVTKENSLLKMSLSTLQSLVVDTFAGFPISGVSNNGLPTLGNTQEYFTKLGELLSSASADPAMVSRARALLTRLLEHTTSMQPISS